MKCVVFSIFVLNTDTICVSFLFSYFYADPMRVWRACACACAPESGARFAKNSTAPTTLLINHPTIQFY